MEIQSCLVSKNKSPSRGSSAQSSRDARNKGREPVGLLVPGVNSGLEGAAAHPLWSLGLDLRPTEVLFLGSKIKGKAGVNV